MIYDSIEAAAHLPEAESGSTRHRSKTQLGPGELGNAGRLWRNWRVVATRGADFLGSQIVERLQALGCGAVVVPCSSDYDLTEQVDVRRLFRDSTPAVVLHLAPQVGGIGANWENPERFFYANMMMGALMIAEARRTGVEKFVQLGTICAYLKHTPVPFREEDLCSGYPEETNASCAIAKKALLVQV